MTEIIKHHPKCKDIAILLSEGAYWIGIYDASLTHQNNEPMYYFYSGMWFGLELAEMHLMEMTGEEF